jgi:outer membrane biogenesis lipoprotein LolB
MTHLLPGVAAAVLAVTLTACASETSHPAGNSTNPEVWSTGDAPPMTLPPHTPKAPLGPDAGSTSGSSTETHDPLGGK